MTADQENTEEKEVEDAAKDTVLLLLRFSRVRVMCQGVFGRANGVFASFQLGVT